MSYHPSQAILKRVDMDESKKILVAKHWQTIQEREAPLQEAQGEIEVLKGELERMRAEAKARLCTFGIRTFLLLLLFLFACLRILFMEAASWKQNK